MFCVAPDPGDLVRISWEAIEKKVAARKAKALIARCGRLDEPIRHDMTDQFTSSAVSHSIISRPQFRYLPIFSAEFTRVSSAVARGVTLYNRG